MTDRKDFLKAYSGEPLRFMEVCGTHTAEISRNGITELLPPEISLISGPGCPVCVTVTDYIDRLVWLARQPETTVVSFGDLLRVPGSRESLADARADGGSIKMAYSPLDILKMAKSEPKRTYVFAAVGFETTAPVYAVLLENAIAQGIENIRLLTSLKTMPPVIDWVCGNGSRIDGFLAPGHVSVITGSHVFQKLAEKHGLPFVIAGFDGEQLLAAVYTLVKCRGRAGAVNLYRSAVTEEGNKRAQAAVEHFFEPCGAAWRGIGIIPSSGLRLREAYARFDAGSVGLDSDHEHNPLCRCAQILTGAQTPVSCPLFGTECTPQHPQGACMVSAEGSCYQYAVHHRKR